MVDFGSLARRLGSARRVGAPAGRETRTCSARSPGTPCEGSAGQAGPSAVCSPADEPACVTAEAGTGLVISSPSADRAGPVEAQEAGRVQSPDNGLFTSTLHIGQTSRSSRRCHSARVVRAGPWRISPLTGLVARRHPFRDVPRVSPTPQEQDAARHDLLLTRAGSRFSRASHWSFERTQVPAGTTHGFKATTPAPDPDRSRWNSTIARLAGAPCTGEHLGAS